MHNSQFIIHNYIVFGMLCALVGPFFAERCQHETKQIIRFVIIIYSCENIGKTGIIIVCTAPFIKSSWLFSIFNYEL